MPKASDIKKGHVVEIDGQVYMVRNVDMKAPSSRGANTLYKIRFTHVTTGQNLDRSCKGDDNFGAVDFLRREVQYSYFDGEMYVFMDEEDYTQYNLTADQLDGQLGYLSEGLGGMIAMLVDDACIGIELPASVNLEITETAPGIKGASASARTKPATLSTGLEIQIPEYLEPGEVVKINTATGKYMSRAND